MTRVSKSEAANILGVSPRTVERYTQRGKLHPTYKQGDNGPEAYYGLEEVEKLKADSAIPLHMSEVVGGDEGQVSEVDEGNNGAIATIPTPLIQAIREIVFDVLQAVLVAQQRSPLAPYRELEEAVEKGWILPSSVVKQLIKVKPSGEVFTRGLLNLYAADASVEKLVGRWKGFNQLLLPIICNFKLTT